MIAFFTILFTVFVAEMGDKTQLMLVGLSSKYKLRDIIIGTALAVLVLNALAVCFGSLFSKFIPDFLIQLVASFVFLIFGFTCLFQKEKEEKASCHNKNLFAPVAVFCIFFLAELGDKTQLTAITFGAARGSLPLLSIWLACSIGLFLADIIGLLAGYFLKTQINDVILKKIAFVLFSIFGFLKLKQGLDSLRPPTLPLVPIMTATIALYVIIIAITFLFSKLRNRQKN